MHCTRYCTVLYRYRQGFSYVVDKVLYWGENWVLYRDRLRFSPAGRGPQPPAPVASENIYLYTGTGTEVLPGRVQYIIYECPAGTFFGFHQPPVYVPYPGKLDY